MTDRDKLIELLEDTLHEWKCDVEDKTLSQIADHLLANGVIVPPCKVGDKLYKLLGEEIVSGWKICSITIYKSGFYITDDCNFHYADNEIGKTVFLTKEEAEAKLKELSGNE